jgi:hypothetical protein
VTGTAYGPSNDAPLMSPTSGIFGCCARAASGQAAAVLPSPAINSRRRIGHLSCASRAPSRPRRNGSEPSVRPLEGSKARKGKPARPAIHRAPSGERPRATREMRLRPAVGEVCRGRYATKNPTHVAVGFLDSLDFHDVCRSYLARY